MDVATTEPQRAKTTSARSTVDTIASPRGIRKYRRCASIKGVRQYVRKTASTNGTSTGRSRYNATPKASSVSVRRQKVCTR